MDSFFSSGLQFGPFRFDPQRRALFRRGKRIALRSKAAAVLEVLLEQSDQVVSKQTLRQRVWGHAGVSDQSLFQAISDVRRALAPMEAVITHPNQGYRLALSVRKRRAWPRALAAALAPLVLAGATVLGAGRYQSADAVAPTLAALSPTMQAFAGGVAQLDAGNPHRAQSLLLLALQENEAFVEARLMLGEAYLAQGKLDQALEEARRVLARNDARAQPDAHASVAAMSLISRIEGSAGEHSLALHWAFEAAQRAHRGGLACTASDMENRIDQLLALRSDAEPEALSAASRLAQPEGQAKRPPSPDFCAKFPSYSAPPDAQMQPGPCLTPAAMPRLAARSRRAKTTV